LRSTSFATTLIPSFGGLALSQAISAAYHTLVNEGNPAAKPRHELFSVQGSYLSPASTDVPTTFVVEDLRSTRTMMTRLVTVSQLFPQKVKPTKPAASSSSSTQEATAPPPPGVKRKVLIAILDFHAPETPFLTYSRQPLHPGPNSYPSPESLPNSNTTLPRLLSGDPKVLKVMMTQFDLPMRMFEHRPVPSSMGAQNALGFLKTKTSQDELDITKRTYTNWVRVRDNLDGPSETYAALG
jgi:acyl-CoA thioesterase